MSEEKLKATLANFFSRFHLLDKSHDRTTKVFAIAGGDELAIGSSNSPKLQFGRDGILLGFYLLPSNFVFQIGICTGLDVQ